MTIEAPPEEKTPSLISAGELKEIAQTAGAERRERISEDVELVKQAVSGFFSGLKEKATGALDTVLGAPEAASAQVDAAVEVVDTKVMEQVEAFNNAVQRGSEAWVGFLERGKAAYEDLKKGFNERKDAAIVESKGIAAAGLELGISGGAWVEGQIAEIYTIPEVIAEVGGDLAEVKQGLIELKEGMISAVQNRSRQMLEKIMATQEEKIQARAVNLEAAREVAEENAKAHRQNAEAYRGRKTEFGLLRKLNNNKGVEQ